MFDSFKDGKICTKIKMFLFRIVDKCISENRKKEVISEFKNNIEMYQKVDEFESKYVDNNDEIVEKKQRYFDIKMAQMDEKKGVKCSQKLIKISSILRLNDSKIINDFDAIARIKRVIKIEKRR